MKTSLRGKLVRGALVLVALTLLVLDGLVLLAFRTYAYKSMEAIMAIQLETGLDYFRTNVREGDLAHFLAGQGPPVLARQKTQVQLINLEGDLVYDSIGALNDSVSNYEDIQEALAGKRATRTGRVDYADQTVMSMSAPLVNSRGQTLGIFRLTTSLESALASIRQVAIYLLIITILVLLMAAIFALVFARSITRSVKKITDGAELMVDGYYKTRIEIEREDELGQLGQALNTLAEEIIRKDQIKNDFISSISHELRTPLTSIKGWAVVLRDMDDPSLVEEGLDIIENESDRLSKMVEELLDFSRYVSGRISLDKEAFDLTETCRDLARQMGPRARNEGIDFRTDLYQAPLVFSGDEDRIRQLLINLIDNAIKFTDEGGWVLLESKLNEGTFEVLVSDNGVGIAQEDLAHVKDKFYKGSHSKSHSGLGLSIADEIAKLHKGSIDIVSEEGVGTTIRVALPLEGREEE